MFGDKIPKTPDYFAILVLSLFHGSLKRQWFWPWVEQPIHIHSRWLSRKWKSSDGEILMVYDKMSQKTSCFPETGDLPSNVRPFHWGN